MHGSWGDGKSRHIHHNQSGRKWFVLNGIGLVLRFFSKQDKSIRYFFFIYWFIIRQDQIFLSL